MFTVTVIKFLLYRIFSMETEALIIYIIFENVLRRNIIFFDECSLDYLAFEKVKKYLY